MDIDMGAAANTVRHVVVNPGKITYGSPTKGGEIYFTFDPEGSFESQKVRAENSMRLLEYLKAMYNDPTIIPPRKIQNEGIGAEVK